MGSEQSERIERAIDERAELQSRLDAAEAIIAKVVTVREEQNRYFKMMKNAGNWSYKDQQLSKCKGLERELDEMIGQYRAPQTSLLS